MKTAAVSQLKTLFSEYLAKVKKGEDVLVTDRGHPVAKLIPFRSMGPEGDERRRLAREGVIRLGRSGQIPREFQKPSPIKDPEGLALKALLEEREEGL